MRDPSVEELRPIYDGLSRIAVVGCSRDRLKPANFVPRYLRAYGYEIVPVNPRYREVLGERCYASLLDVPRHVDVVQLFRPPEEAPAFARNAVAIGAGCLWMQLGVESDEAARIAREGGLTVVADRCMGVVHAQLGLGPGLHTGDEWHRGLDPPVPRSAGEQPRLRVTAGPAAGLTIPTDRELAIGREVEGEGRIADDPEISREHARLSRNRHDQVLLQDVGSTNGTYVNGARVDEQVLGIGDTVQLGSTTLALELPEARRPASVVRDRAELAQVTAARVLATSPAADPVAFRAEFPVLERAAYLNAGSDGPPPRRALEAATSAIGAILEHGRSSDAHARQLRSVTSSLRSRYAGVLGCDADEVALTGSTHDGVNTVVRGLHLRRRDELLTSDQEHPSLLVPLAAAARRAGADMRAVPFAELPEGVGPRTRLVACSHVSWVSGQVADVPALVASGAPVLLDGAQALGAMAVDVHALGCDYYAASGQKWLCGPEGAGCLYVRRERRRSLAPPWPSELSLGDARDPADLVFHAEARRFDTAGRSVPLSTWALAALEVLDDAGWDWLLERGPRLAGALADSLAERGLRVAPRGRSTLVCWSADEPEETVVRLAEAGVVVRSIPARRAVRASVGAWNGDEDLERLVHAVV